MVQLEPENIEEETEEHSEDYTRIESVFNNNLTDIFHGSSVDDALDSMFEQTKKHVEHPALTASVFAIKWIIPINVDFHKQHLTKRSSYIALPAWIK